MRFTKPRFTTSRFTNQGSLNQGSLNQSFYRYSAKERAGSDKDELKDCNTLAGAKVFGLQAEESNFNCENEKLMDNTMESQSVDRMVITTFGSFLADSLQKWSKQVISLVQADSFRYILFRQITTFIKVHVAFVFGLQTL